MVARLLFLILWTALSVASVSGAHAVEPDGRPTIGLVLGGGAAKGLSHVGVLKVLEDNQIPVDVVAGTSIGAIVGSLYASGYTVDEIETIATELDWNGVFADGTERGKTQFRRKSDDFGFLTDVKITFDNGRLVLPSSLIQGQTFYQELSRILTRSYAVENFDELPKPFRAVATDLSTGKPVILKDGNLVSAVFASMAIPGLIPPVVRGDQYLIDGAFSNNVPVNLARDMGADILIVAEVGEGPKPAEELGNVVDVIRQLQVLLTIDNTKNQLDTLSGRDILIRPDLSGIGLASFTKVRPIIEIGANATEAMLPALKQLSLSDVAWAQHKTQSSTIVKPPPRIDEIVVHQNTKLSDKVLRAGLSAEIGEPLDVEQLTRDIEKLYGDGVYRRISYKILPEGNRNVLEISATARESADGYFRFGVALDSNLEDQSAFRLGVAYTKPQINSWGGEFRSELVIGDRIDGRAEFYQPIGFEQDFFIEPSITIARRKDDFFDDDDRRRGRIKAFGYGGSLQSGALLGRWGEVRVGVNRENIDLKFTDDTLGFGKIEIEDASLFGRFSIDTLNNLSFPTNGSLLLAEYEDHSGILGGEADYEAFEILALQPITKGRHTVVFNGQLSGAKGDGANLLGASNLGGFLSLSGYSEDELSGTYSALGLAGYFYRLNQKSALFDAPIYIGASLEAGNVYQDFDDIAFDNLVYASSVFAGLDSPIGPIFLGVGFNDEGRQSVYFSIGGFF